MDPAAFGISTIPLKHAPYGPITPEALVEANKDKVAVVTGAGRGIGQGIAISLAKSGANVAILDQGVDRLAETRAACEKEGVKVEAYACNVAAVADVRSVFKQITSDLGPIDILVNNAGINTFEFAHEQTFEEFWKVVEVNLGGTMITIFEVLRSMRERGSGCIINIASRAATVDVPGGLSYGASKAAIPRATSTLQTEFEVQGIGESLHTYALHPGGVWTAMAKGEGPEVAEKQAAFRDLFKDGPELCGQTCAYLATGRAKELRGMYFDCRQDIELVCRQGREALQKQHLYELKVDFIDGYCNEP